MKIKIERPPYYDLWNIEFPLVATRTITIAKKYDTTSMHLGKSFGELSSFVPQLEAVEIFERKNAKNVQGQGFDRERDILINVARKIVNAYEPVEMPEVRPHYETLDALFAKHEAAKIASSGLTSETQKLFLLEKDVTSDPAVQEAVNVLGIRLITDRLFAVNREFDDLFHEIIAEKSALEKIDVVALRKSCTKALGQFFDAIQYCAFEHEDVDYMPLVKELQALNNYYIQQLKARATRRKSGKNTGEEEPITPPDESGN